MTAGSHTRDACRACGSRELVLALKLAPSPIGDAYRPPDKAPGKEAVYPLDLHLCRSCSLFQLLNVLSPDLVYGEYIYETTTSPGLVDHYKRYSEDVLARVSPPEGSLVVELGSNDGTFLRFFKEAGHAVLGVDPAKVPAKKASDSGVETLVAYFDQDIARRLREERGSAAVVLANMVLANIDDLDAVAEGVRTLLAPDGVFVFETGYLLPLIEEVFDNIYHEHLSYFSVKSLQALFAKHGMELIRADRTPSKGGSIRGTVQLRGGPRPAEPSVGELLALEERAGAGRVETYKAMAARIDKRKAEVLALVSKLKGEGKRLAGYGAAPSVTTFMRHFELCPHLDFLADDNPIKHGTVSPADRIPVVPSEELYSRAPDHVIILAWRFHEPIVRRHRKYVERGGRFIIPWPTVRVL